MKAVIESAGGVGSQAKLGSHVMVFDQEAAVPGGEDRGPSPLDVMVASVAACAHYFASAFLFARKISPEGLSVEVEAEKTREPGPRIGKLSLKLVLPAQVPEKYAASIERAVKNCPAYGTLIHPPDVALTVVGALSESTAPAA